MKRWPFALCFLSAISAANAQSEGEPGDFDFYVLALSWSPTWCATADDTEESPQCAADAEFGFVVHGLWPQYEEGYPEFCQAGGRPSPAAVNSILDIMPDTGLVEHTWRKHGSCSGLDPDAYLETTRGAFERVRIPRRFAHLTEGARISARQMEEAFAESNPGLEMEGLAISCGGGFLEEVRVCLTRDLAFRSCEEVDARGCRRERLRLPAPQ